MAFDALVGRPTDPGSIGSMRNRAAYAVVRNVPYPAYAELCAAYSALNDRQ